MFAVVLIIHFMIAVALVAIILLQRSEGGALGIGGGGGGFMTGRGAANVLTRTTAILAAGFFVCSIVLTFLSQPTKGPGSVIDALPGTPSPAGDSASKSKVPAPATLPQAPATPSVPVPQ